MAEVKTSGPGPGFAKTPDHYVRVEPSPRRVRAVIGGETIADSTRMSLLHEANHLPVYYFPLEDVRLDLMAKTDTSTHCPYKGDASYWSLTLGGRSVDDILWSYETPFDEVPELAGLAAFYWKKVDRWYEEDEEIFVTRATPISASTRSRRRARCGWCWAARRWRRRRPPISCSRPGCRCATTSRARTCAWTCSPRPTARPAAPIRARRSTGRPRSAGGAMRTSSGATPTRSPNARRSRDLMCFYNENVDAIFVDGVEVEKPKTKWSK